MARVPATWAERERAAKQRAAKLHETIVKNHARTGDELPGFLGVYRHEEEPARGSMGAQRATVEVRHERVVEVITESVCPSEADAWLCVAELARLLADQKAGES